MASTKDRIWDNYIVIGQVRKSARRKFVVAAATRVGYRYINIREFCWHRDGRWTPGRDGITIPLKTSLDHGESFIEPLAHMIHGLEVAAETAATMELSDPAHAVWRVPKELKPTEETKDGLV